VNQVPKDLGHQYRSALARYLSKPEEASLSQAYELGRMAIGQGLGILDIATMHEEAVATLIPPSVAEASSSLTRAANQFFREGLSPFEMTFRGYREANEELHRVNDTLFRQKDELERINQELESFSYTVSHDLKSPLRNIEGFSKALLEDSYDRLDEQGRKHVHRIREGATRMRELIEDLLSLSRLSQSTLCLVRVDLTSLAQQVLERLRESEPNRKVEVAVEQGIFVNGDEGLLGVVLENLLGNAWKFTSKRERGKIEFGRAQQKGRTVYFVRDNGAGFDMTYAEKLFTPFQRLHSSSEFDGTGIGLATVERIVDRHRGEVWAEGEVNRGATFYFTLGA
jgi:light-regulated signal transduction histidine kinase (bacteriophytochrome)